jgi:hypothetical protein
MDTPILMRDNLFCSVNFFPAKILICLEGFSFSKKPKKKIGGKKLTKQKSSLAEQKRLVLLMEMRKTNANLIFEEQ